jgi:predicted HNH restriction endonuclease
LGFQSGETCLAKLRKGDIIIAYQTDRNEIVGIAQVTQSCQRGKRLHLKPVMTIGVKVRPLKESDQKIDAIPALKAVWIQTIYDISDSDAHRLLKAAGVPQKLLSRLQTTTRTSEEETFVEGEKRTAARAERNARLRVAAKKKWGVKCYCCGFDFEQFYGSIAKNAGVVHHLELFTANNKKRKTTVEDVRVVCANCHYVLYLTKPPMDVDDLKKVITKSWRRWSENGYERKG